MISCLLMLQFTGNNNYKQSPLHPIPSHRRVPLIVAPWNVAPRSVARHGAHQGSVAPSASVRGANISEGSMMTTRCLVPRSTCVTTACVRTLRWSVSRGDVLLPCVTTPSRQSAVYSAQVRAIIIIIIIIISCRLLWEGGISWLQRSRSWASLTTSSYLIPVHSLIFVTHCVLGPPLVISPCGPSNISLWIVLCLIVWPK